MELLPGVQAVETALFITPLNMLVISDLQLGQEEELRSQGHLVLDKELSQMKQRLGRLLRRTGATRLLINGDIKHEFSRINQQEWDHILDLFTFFQEKKVEVILIKGNHDTMLFPIAQKRGFSLLDNYSEGGFLFCHGHELPPEEQVAKVKVVVIGHEHPAVRFDDGVRKETAKCFLLGPWNDKQLIVLPSFSEMTIGTNILTSKGLGPFVKEKKEFAAFVVIEDTVLRFGTVVDIEAAMNMRGS